MTEGYETSTMSTTGTRNEPKDINMDYLARLDRWFPAGVLPNGILR